MAEIEGRITKLEFFSDDAILISFIQENKGKGTVQRQDITVSWKLYEQMAYKLRDMVKIKLS